MFKHGIIIISFICCSVKLFAQQSSFVKLNPNGTLTYTADEKGNTIPDFSAVGYRRSDAELPNVPVVKIVNAATSGSSQQIIQDAIDEVAQMPLVNGFRGAILFKSGTYNIPGTIKVEASGIVLRGEGENNGGTKWVATGTGQRNLVEFVGAGSRTNLTATRSDITDAFVPVGTYYFNVSSTSGYSVGDKMMVVRPGTDQWIQDLKMDVMEGVPQENQWRASQYTLYFEREITDIQGNKVYIDNPIMQEMEIKYGGGHIMKYSYPGRISDVGIEYIRLESEYANDTDEDHGWVGIDFRAVEHGWARNVITRYFGYSGFLIAGNSKYVTIKDSKCLDPKSQISGGRRYSFNIGGRSQLNLITGCHATEGRHDFVTGARTGGPNVFHNSTSSNAHSDVGPHQRWAVGTLYDNIDTDAIINVQDRGHGGGDWQNDDGNGHGWTGVTQVLWNCSSSDKISVQSPWVSGKNYAIAVQGSQYSGKYFSNRPDGEWELRNSNVTPSSLFEAQLNARRAVLALQAKLKSFVGELKSGKITVRWATELEQNLISFELLHSTNNFVYTTIATINASNNVEGGNYSYDHANISSGLNYYKLIIKGANAQTELPVFISVMGTSSASEILFKQDFEQGIYPADFIRTSNGSKVFLDTLGTTSGTTDNQATFAIANGKAVLGKTITGTARGFSYMVKRNFNPSNAQFLRFKFDVDLNYTGNSSNSIFQILFGKNFTEDGLPNNEDTNKSYTRITFNGFGGSNPTRFRVRANASSDASTTNDGPQTITVFMNTSLEPQQYIGLDNQSHTLPSKNYNVWIGNLKQKFGANLNENMAASNPSTLPLQDFKIVLTGGEPSTLDVDNIEVSVLPIVLPVTLTSFTAVPKQNGVQLQWQTSSEQNNSHFDILRSVDGKDFSKIGMKTGMGYSSIFNTYHFTDYRPLIGTNYYKLSQVDFDGKVKEYEPLSVNYQLDKQSLFAFLSTDDNLNVVYNAAKSGNVNLLISDILGRKIYSKTVYLEQGTNQKSIPRNILSKGMHIIYLITQNESSEVYQTKFINH